MTYGSLIEWAQDCALTKPLERPCIEFVKAVDDAKIKEFSQFCGSLILDRVDSDSRFEEKRPIIYKKWLRSDHPCLMSVRHPSGVLLATSIVLPLTAQSYADFFNFGHDSIDMDRDHFTEPGAPQDTRYLLIDVLAANLKYLLSLPGSESREFRGIAYRALIYHLYTFAGTNANMILLCSTRQTHVVAKIRGIGFENAIRNGRKTEQFRLDLTRPRLDLSADSQAFIRLAAETMQSYAIPATQELAG
jgi:hypothetical protein